MTTTTDTNEHDAAIRVVEAEFLALANRFRRLIARNAELLSPGLLPGAYRVFSTVARNGPVTASSVAEQMEVDKSHLSRLIVSLEEHGLLTRSPDPTDGRAQLLEATPEAKRRLDEIRSPRENHLFRELQNWDLSEVQHLGALLHALTAGAPGAEDERALRPE